MKHRLALPVALALCALPAAATATVLQLIENEITSEGKTLAHPRSMVIELPIRVTVTGKARACVRYKTTVPEAKAKISVRVEHLAGGSLVEPPVEFRGKVKKTRDPEDPAIIRQFFRCSKTLCPSDEPPPPGTEPDPEDCVPDADLELNETLRRGDTLRFILEYRKFGKLSEDDKARVIVGVQP